MQPIRLAVAAACGALLAACDDGTYTLYRNSPVGDDMRIHVASFDTKEGDGYNRENCNHALKLYNAQPGVTARFWCEKGPFRK